MLPALHRTGHNPSSVSHAIDRRRSSPVRHHLCHLAWNIRHPWLESARPRVGVAFSDKQFRERASFVLLLSCSRPEKEANRPDKLGAYYKNQQSKAKMRTSMAAICWAMLCLFQLAAALPPSEIFVSDASPDGTITCCTNQWY